MFQKLEDVEKRYEELNKKISDPEIIAKQSEWQKYMKEHAALVDVAEKYIDSAGAFDISKCGLIAYANGGYYNLDKKIGKFGYSVQKNLKK